MVESDELATDRIIIKLDPGQPIELSNLSGSFAALARMYERHHRSGGDQAPKLYVTRLETGSIIAEVVPYATMLGAIIYTMDSAVIVADFTNRLSRGIRAFAGQLQPIPSLSLPSQDDAADIREFVRPLTGKRGAALGIKHAKLHIKDGTRETVAEYTFDETEINRAALNIDEALNHEVLAVESVPMIEAQEGGAIRTEVMLFFEQASRKPGKERGKTSDRAIVPEVTDKSLPVHFRQGLENLKDKMVRGDVNPLTCTFVVDVHVQNIGGEPKGYIVTEVHRIIPPDDDE